MKYLKQVIVTGGRDFQDQILVDDILDFIKPDLIIQGGATGADFLACLWAQENGVKIEEVAADWLKHGKAAGPIRNREMIKQFPCATIVAFPGNSGTRNCVKTALSMNRLVLEVRDNA